MNGSPSEAEVTSLLVYKSPAWKGGVLYSFDDLGGFIAYVDPDTFRRKGNLAKMWQLVDLKMTKTLEGRSFLSIKRMDEYNCMEEFFTCNISSSI
jgi:hypothetical protein